MREISTVKSNIIIFMVVTGGETGFGFMVDSRHPYGIIGAYHNVALPISCREKRSVPARGFFNAVEMGQ